MLQSRARRVPWRLLVLAGLVLAVVAAALWLWETSTGDRGEVLVLRDELPGEDGRIARHRVVYLDGPAEFRTRAGEEDARVAILPASRIAEVGEEWVEEQTRIHSRFTETSCDELVFVVVLEDDLPPGASAADLSETLVDVTLRASNGGGWNRQHTYGEWRSSAARHLDAHHMFCGREWGGG